MTPNIGGWVPILRDPVRDLTEAFPVRLRAGARSLWLEILMRARQRPGIVRGIRLRRGQMVLGEEEIGTHCGLTRHQVRARLRRLQQLGEVAIKADNHGSTVTVVHYEVYVADRATDSQRDRQQTARERPEGGHKQKEKREKKDDTASSDRSRDGFMDDMQLLFTDCWPHFNDVPFSLFAKWRKEYGADAVLAMAKRIGLSGKEFDRMGGLTAYFSAALANEDGTRVSEPPPPLAIANALGKPVTDPDERLRRITKNGFSCDPDQGYWFTIPDTVVQAKRMDSETRKQLLARQSDQGEAP